MPEKDRQLSLLSAQLRTLIRECVAGAQPWPLLLWGTPGTGKTCAGLVLLDYAGGMYFPAQTLANEIAAAYRNELRFSAKAIWGEVAKTSLVVLDEIGARSKVTDHQYDCLKRVLDDREGKPLVCISNLDLESIAQVYDDRIASRLAAGTVGHVVGEDRRLKR